LAKEGASLALFDMTEQGLQTTKKQIESSGKNVVTDLVDVTNAEELQHAVDKVVKHFGRLDGMVNAAGILSRNPKPVGELDLQDFLRVMEINTTGVALSMHAAVNYLEYGASIVNIARFVRVLYRFQA
jgi:3-oxoacyl-[acyl-carrier protein] reductase